MTRPRLVPNLAAPILLVVASTAAMSQTTAVPHPASLDASVAGALLANPITAPYPIDVAVRGGRLVLRGRVGSKAVHDAAVRMAIDFGMPIADELVIDTTAPVRVVARTIAPGPVLEPLGTPSLLPSPLFGRWDDPFLGMDPPPILYPPWWPELSRRRLAGIGSPAIVAAPRPLPAPRTVEMTIDPLGYAEIRGAVPTEADRLDVAARLAQTPGVVGIINRLTVDPAAAGVAAAGPTLEDRPPPPPTPAVTVAPAAPAEPSGMPIVTSAPARPTDPVAGRVGRALRAHPDLAGQTVEVSASDGIVSLGGTLPGVYEAMVAYRIAEQTPGVKAVTDTIRFVVPDGNAPNPLIARGKPEDVEPYLLAQIRRQVGDLAHVDRVRLSGVQVEVGGTLERADDRPTVEATLRSMPILRGFTLLPEFRASGG